MIENIVAKNKIISKFKLMFSDYYANFMEKLIEIIPKYDLNPLQK